MAKYKGKTVAVEAFQWNGGYDAKEDPRWFTAAMKKKGDELGAIRMFGDKLMKIVGPGKLFNVNKGDFVVKGTDEIIFSLTPEIFKQLFVAA